MLPWNRSELRALSKHLKSAGTVLTAFHHAREGTQMEMALAAATSLGALIENLVPEEHYLIQVSRRGWTSVSTDIGKFLCKWLMNSNYPRQEFKLDGPEKLIVWGKEGVEEVAAVYEGGGGQYVSGPYLKGETFDKSLDRLIEIVSEIVWATGNDLMLDAPIVGRRDLRPDEGSHTDYRLHNMRPPGPYIGDPDVDWYVNRMRRHEKHGPARSMMLVGPSGAGKSVLARHIARALAGSDARVLKVAGNVLQSYPVTDLSDLIRFLRPTVVLLDDVPISEWGQNEVMLAVLEALHERDTLILATFMQDRPPTFWMDQWDDENGISRTKKRRDGTIYYPGMRPGRIDEVVLVKRPNKAVREKILRHYLGNEFVDRIPPEIFAGILKKSKNLSGAYLAEISKRLQVHGVEGWREEIESIRAMAPRVERNATKKAQEPPGNSPDAPTPEKDVVANSHTLDAEQVKTLVREAVAAALAAVQNPPAPTQS